MRERHKAVPAVYLILKKEGEVLLMQRQNTGYYDGYYALPAGHVEAGEMPLEALVRETMEELGVALDPADAKLVHTMYRAKHDETGERVDMFFISTKWAGEIVNAEPHKCGDIQWFSISEFPQNMMDHVRDGILLSEQGVNFSEYNSEHVYKNPSVSLL